MTLNSTIIAAAYRESNFIGQGDTPSATEQTEGLQLLQSLVDSFHGSVIGQKPKSWWVPHPNKTAADAANYPAAPGVPEERTVRDAEYPPANSRVLLRNTTPQTINLQYEPQDGAIMEFVDAGFTESVTIQGNGCYIGTNFATSVVLFPQAPSGQVPRKTYVFRGDLATWYPTNDLVYAGENPYPAEFDDYWITSLAMRLAPRFGNEPRQITMLRNKDMLSFIRGWYRQTAETLGNGAERSAQAYHGGSYSSDPDRGRV